MRKKMLKLTWALLLLAGGLTATFTPKNAAADTCRDDYDSCRVNCSPDDSLCFQECQCFFAACRGFVCN